MSRITSIIRIFCAGALAFGCGSAAQGRTWTVGKGGTPCGRVDYATIGAAVGAASAGDTIEICPALYPEQIVIDKPLSLVGVPQNGVNRVLIQPANVAAGIFGFAAVIAAVNTAGVTISNVAVDASKNRITGCATALAGIHFYNSSGLVDGVAVTGAALQNQSCTTLYPGNGFGIQIDTDRRMMSPFHVSVRNTSIHDYSRDGILAAGTGVTVDLSNNTISGNGPAAGVNQFGIFLADGVTGQVRGNVLSQANCGTLPFGECFDLRSEGVVLRGVGDGVVVSRNVINGAQAGIFINGATNARVSDNLISNIDALDGIHVQGSVTGVYSGNRIFHVAPINSDASENGVGCGINMVSGADNSQNTITGNGVNDAYCGIAYVTGDQLENNFAINTLYPSFNGDDYPIAFPPAVEPGQSATRPTAPVWRRKVE